jgi:hypothetical protein
MDLVTFVSLNAIRRFHFALVDALDDGKRNDGSGILYRVVRFEIGEMGLRLFCSTCKFLSAFSFGYLLFSV